MLERNVAEIRYANWGVIAIDGLESGEAEKTLAKLSSA